MLPGGVFLRLAFVAVTVLASINGPCTIGEQAGTCVATADCTAKGGSFQDNFCPDDPDDIKCCVGCDTSSTASNTASTSSNTAASSDSVDTSLVNASNNAGGGAPSLSNAYSSSTTPPTLTLTSSNQGYPDVASQPALSGSVVQAPTSPGYPDVASQSPPSPPAMFPNQGQASSPTSGQNSDNSGSGSGSGSGAAHPAPSRYGDLSASGNRNNRPAPSHYGDLSGFNRAGGAPGGLPGLSGQIGPGQFPPVYGRPNGGQTASACHFVTPAAKALVKAKEGFESSNPDDGFGNPTCGFGHLCIKKGCAEIQPHFTLPLTKASASKLLDMDLYKDDGPVGCLKKHLGGKAVVNANEYGALVSLIYNVGCGQYSDTSIKAAINSGRRASDVIAEKFPDYSKANGAVVDGLVTRRHEEIAFAKKPTNMISYPCN